MKPYKSKSPLETINNIRGILSDIGIFTTENHISYSDLFCSCRVIIDDNIQGLDIGTNGKGMNTQYALASAYGEMMERLQNRMLGFAVMKFTTSSVLKDNPNLEPLYNMLSAEGLVGDFRYYPDEKEYSVSKSELLKQVEKFLPNIYGVDNESILKSNKYKLIEAPFFNVNSQKVENVPLFLFRLAASSTGLCAGNTPQEAILQGLNEIFERYVLQRLYVEKVTPPTIPATYFKGTNIVARLEKLRLTKNVYYEIKDCSLDGKYPVIGLLLIDRSNNTYAFRLGADASPIIALERCYTEAFQGVKDIKNHFRPINFNDSFDIKLEHDNNVVNGSGKFPNELFLNKPSYDFKGFVFSGKESDEAELKYYIKHIENLGYTTYVRDNSFLNFPAYTIFIPGLSDISGELLDFYQHLEDANCTYSALKPAYNIKSLNDDELVNYAATIENNSSNNISLFPYYIGLHNNINKHLLLMGIYFKTGNIHKAYKNMSIFLTHNERTGISQSNYYYAIRDYLYWKSKDKHANTITSILSRFYGEKIADEVTTDLADPSKILDNFKFPQCFDCQNCPARSECKFIEMVRMENRIQKIFKSNLKDQINLEEIFK
ncbi:MAG: YcaO-like family protein [Bacteroidales bacterium]